MGIYSTMEISRSDAINKIEKMLECLDNLSNEDLSEIMFVLFGDKLGANFRILE